MNYLCYHILQLQVDNTKLLRNILQLLYAEYKKGMTKHETKSIYNKLMSIKQNPATKMKNGKNLEFIDVSDLSFFSFFFFYLSFL